MQEYSLARTSNVKKAEELFTYLRKRPKTEMVGLGLIYGPPGLGKSRFARQTAIRRDYIYLRLEATMTARSFSMRLLERVQYYFGMPAIKHKRTANCIFNDIIKILMNNPDTVIILDEIDYAFKSYKILGSIRDIVDLTLSTVVLVGMADAKENLLKADEHYFDRCNFFCEFKEHSLYDIKVLCAELTDLKIEESVYKYIVKKTKGNIRKLVKIIHSFEYLAQTNDLIKIGAADINI